MFDILILIHVSVCVILVIMGSPLFPRESGKFVAERSQDVFVEEKGVQKVAEMLYALRQSDSLTASSWKKANPLAPASTSDQGSYEYTSGELQGTFDIFHVEETSGNDSTKL